MHRGLLAPVRLPHTVLGAPRTPSWSVHSTERVRRPPPHVLVHYRRIMWSHTAYVSVTNELTGDHWPCRYENICTTCPVPVVGDVSVGGAVVVGWRALSI